MRIDLESSGTPLNISEDGKVFSTPQSKIYVRLNPHYKKIPKRHPGELVLRNGWVHLDYDDEGFLVGLEVVEGDPYTGVTECIEYLQPTNPMVS